MSVGSYYPFKRHRVPHFLPKLTCFVRFTPIFADILLVFVPCTPILAVFMLRTSLLTPYFCSFYLPGCLWHPTDAAVLKRQWLRDAATTKIWVPSENLSFGPSLTWFKKNHKQILASAGQNYITFYAQGGSSISESGKKACQKSLFSAEAPKDPCERIMAIDHGRP